MPEDTRDTWPAPPDGMQIEDLSFERSLLLLHLKLDVMGRELFQVQKQVKSIATQLDLTRLEVMRHGKCLAPATLVDPAKERSSG